MPSRTYLLAELDQSRVPSLQRVVLRAFSGTTNPSDSLPAPPAFDCPALCVRSAPDVGCQVGSLLFRISLWKRAAAHTPRRSSQSFRSQLAVCCLPRDMSGSALPNTFRLRI